MIELDQLVRLAAGELEDREVAVVEEHVLGCTPCALVLERLVAVGDGVRELVHGGKTMFHSTSAMVAELDRAGLISRRYSLRPGQTVPCTASAADVYSSTRLAADFAGLSRVDLVIDSIALKNRIDDVPFDPIDNAVWLITRSDLIRTFPSMQLLFTLVAVEPSGERTLGQYTLDHTAFTL